MQPRLYHPPAHFLFGGCLFTVVGLLSGAYGFYHLLVGEPMMISHNHGAAQPATAADLPFLILFPTTYLALGACILNHYINARILVSEDGVVATNFLRREIFQASWQELLTTAQKGDFEGAGVYIYAGNRQLTIRNRRAYQHIVEELRRRSDGAGCAGPSLP